MRGFGPLSAACSFLLLLAFASGAQAATYYVRNGGNDNADGRSHATAWATIGKVNDHSFSAGDSVLFHEGDVFTGAELTVDWSGTASKHAVIGAYYVESGTERRGVRNARPKFDGKDQRPSSRWYGLINVLRDRVRVENLALINSEGMGARFVEADFGQAVNLLTRNTYDAGIRFQSCNDGLIEGNQVSDAARAWPEDGDSLGNSVKWASAVVAHHGSSRMIIRRNTVSKVFGEGINVHHGSSDALIEKNFIFAARAAGIYVDASPNATIRRNMIVGTSNSEYWRNNGTVAPGIVLSNEPFHYEGSNALSPDVGTRNITIYANLVAYTARGIAFWGSAGHTFDNTYIYNNTFVDNDIQFATTGSPMPGSVFANNIVYSVSTGTKDVAQKRPDGLTAKNNYFSQGDPGAPFSHSGNLYKGLQLTRMSGWRDLKNPDQVSWRDFAPSAASSTNGAGTGIQVAKTLASLVSSVLHLDFNANPHNDPVDMGAVRRSSGKVPKGPAALGAQAER